ncbi:MAG TPA: type II secretion system F family protein, partial [Burkholderiales bacterium]
MATATAVGSRDKIKEYTFLWEGKDKSGRLIKGDMKAGGEAVVNSTLRRQGIQVVKIKRLRSGIGGRVSDKDITFFTRQLATMMKSGVPLLQAFDIVGKGHSNPAVARLLMDIKNEVETGNSLTMAFRKYPLYFDQLFCNLVAAGEQAGILDSLLDRLATYKEKILAIKSKIKSALFYPISVVVVAIVVVWVIMVFVVPAFKKVFANFGADLPAPTLIVIAISEWVVSWWWAVFLIVIATVISFGILHRRSPHFRLVFDRVILKFPIIGGILEKATIARWTRTLQTM